MLPIGNISTPDHSLGNYSTRLRSCHGTAPGGTTLCWASDGVIPVSTRASRPERPDAEPEAFVRCRRPSSGDGHSWLPRFDPPVQKSIKETLDITIEHLVKIAHGETGSRIFHALVRMQKVIPDL